MLLSTLHDFEIRMGFKEQNDIVQYEFVDEKIRNQVFILVSRLINEELKIGDYYWKIVEDITMLEFGIPYFRSDSRGSTIHKEMMEQKDIEALYIIEVMLKKLYELNRIIVESTDANRHRDSQKITDIMSKVNKKMLENSLGYEFIEGQLIRVDNKFIHSEVIINAIKLLHEEEFESASNEYHKAFDEYKKGELENALVFARRSFESTMKIICDRLGYHYRQRGQSFELIGILKQNNFIPTELKYHFEKFTDVMQSGLPTVSNKESHGKGILIEKATEKMVQYALNLCATNIVFLVETYKEHINGR